MVFFFIFWIGSENVFKLVGYFFGGGIVIYFVVLFFDLVRDLVLFVLVGMIWFVLFGMLMRKVFISGVVLRGLLYLVMRRRLWRLIWLSMKWGKVMVRL